jgi:hypothetical protein
MGKCTWSSWPFRLRSSQSYRKEVEFGKDGKVLLSRIGDKIHATSAFCELVAQTLRVVAFTYALNRHSLWRTPGQGRTH